MTYVYVCVLYMLHRRSEGLDWLVHECGLRGIRLLPVLTNGGSAELGGMKQYVDWVDPMLTVADFYTNDTIKVGLMLLLIHTTHTNITHTTCQATVATVSASVTVHCGRYIQQPASTPPDGMLNAQTLSWQVSVTVNP